MFSIRRENCFKKKKKKLSVGRSYSTFFAASELSLETAFSSKSVSVWRIEACKNCHNFQMLIFKQTVHDEFVFSGRQNGEDRSGCIYSKVSDI